MNRPNPPPGSEAANEQFHAGATDQAPAPFSIMQAIQQLMAERKQFEQFAEESYARVNQLWEQIRAEKAATETERETRLETLQHELETARNEASQLRAERDMIGDELAQFKQQVGQQAKQSAEFEELLQALVVEVGQREDAAAAQRHQFEEERCRFGEEIKTLQQHEQSLNEQLSKARETANKVVQTEQNSGDLAEMAAMIEQVETEIRQEQEAIRQERETLARERAELVRWSGSLPGQPAAPAAPAAAVGASAVQGMLTFACKYCQGSLQAKEWLAGLVTKCHHCGKMAPVPKLGS